MSDVSYVTYFTHLFLNVQFQGTGRDMANSKCGSTMEEPSNSVRRCYRLESWVSDIKHQPIFLRQPIFSLLQLVPFTSLFSASRNFPARPPPYSPPTGGYYQAPPPAYSPPQGPMYGFVPTQTFPDAPPG